MNFGHFGGKQNYCVGSQLGKFSSNVSKRPHIRDFGWISTKNICTQIKKQKFTQKFRFLFSFGNIGFFFSGPLSNRAAFLANTLNELFQEMCPALCPHSRRSVCLFYPPMSVTLVPLVYSDIYLG
jgi:hypothetical protein